MIKAGVDSIANGLMPVQNEFLLNEAKGSWTRAVVVAQLVERSLPTSEICSSNPEIGKILSTNCIIEKTKIKKKRPGMAHL